MLLERYWDKFVRGWDVLLHGNPAVAIYNATKLSGGGELGIGVGEEEWGSGEREVLEDFIDRTEGLKDLIVGRYGLPPDTERAPTSANSKREENTWLGTGNDPSATDGIIFSGKGLISRRSLCTISKWMENIFKYGDDSYGITDNPTSRPRARRKRQKVERTVSSESPKPAQEREVHPKVKPQKKRAPDLRKRAMENSAAPPGIPAPIVGQVERSLDQALAGAGKRNASKSPQRGTAAGSEQESSTFGTDNMMKYLTLGYGTSWTLNPKGLKSDQPEPKQQAPKPPGEANSSTTASSDEQTLQEVDPTPEVSEDDKPFRQKLEQSPGRFLIGLSGDLEQMELDLDTDDSSDNSDTPPRSDDHRLFIRTLMIEMSRPEFSARNPTIRTDSGGSTITSLSKSSGRRKPPTSAEDSIDGPQPNHSHEKVRLAIYVHQPFMFVFLFDLQTANLSIPSFYRSIHNQLGPLQKPLLRSTDPSRITERIAAAMGEKSSVSSTDTSPQTGNPIYDLVYDPVKNTVRTSIPNIPIPGSLAAEGLTSNASSSLSVSGSWYTLGIPIGSSPLSNTPTSPSSDRLTKTSWSRTEALNAHTQILHTYLATRNITEFEHTAKTSRGWWVLWMKISPSRSLSPQSQRSNTSNNNLSYVDSNSTTGDVSNRSHAKEAFLVRRAADFRPGVTANSRSVSTGPGRWLLREQKKDRDVSATGGVGGVSAKGVSEGVGVDARKWVDGLLSLTS